MKKALANIKLVYYIIYIAAILAAVSGYYILKAGVHVDPQSQLGITLSSMQIIFIIATVPTSLALFNRMTKKWALLEDEDLKIKKYIKGSIIRLIIIGIGFITGVILYYILKSQSMLFLAGMSAIAVFFCKPTEIKIITELKLDPLD